MAIYQALGAGPVSFVDGNQNQQELPLSAVFFTANGLDASASPLNTTPNQPLITALLQQMVSQGYVTQGTQPVSPPTLEITAVQAGPIGNLISVVLSDPTPSAGTITMQVTTTEVYSGLTPETVEAALGSSVETASGLVFWVPGNGTMPGSLSGPIGADNDFAFPEAGNPGETAFKVTATNTSDGVQNVTVAVTPAAGSSPTSFTLTASWSATATAALQSLLTTNPFAYLVSIAGQPGPLPAAGTVTLQGGAAAVQASASILASS